MNKIIILLLTPDNSWLNAQSMSGRIILQDMRTHCYLGDDGAWETSCQQARLFDRAYLAVLEGLKHPEQMQVVWCFQNPSQNLYMPVRPGDEHLVFPCEACALAGLV